MGRQWKTTLPAHISMHRKNGVYGVGWGGVGGHRRMSKWHRLSGNSFTREGLSLPHLPSILT